MDIHINYMAVFVAALAQFFVGWAWFSVLFVKPWMKEMGMKVPSKKEREKMMKGMWKPMLGNFASLLLTAWVLAYIVQFAGIAQHESGAVLGLKSGFYVWLGFFATTLMNTVFWERKSWKFYAINASHYLVGLLLMGLILGAWS